MVSPGVERLEIHPPKTNAAVNRIPQPTASSPSGGLARARVVKRTPERDYDAVP
jgi:hypothetical protein